MPIVFEEVTGEIAPQRGGDEAAMSAPAPDTAEDTREKLLRELMLLRERQQRLFAD